MTTATLAPRNRSRKPACGRALADHQFVGCLERTAATETWESRSPDGKRTLVKVLFNVCASDKNNSDNVARLQRLKHAHLVPARILPGGPGCLVVATAFPEATLFDRLKQQQAIGETGIPRKDLLGWLWTTAIALDEIAKEFGVAHLALSPRHLHLSGDKLFIAEHGLAQLIWLPSRQFQGQVQARYAAPEVADNVQGGSASDQFSLAAIFQELLTGSAPYRTRPAGPPDLTPLTDADRAVIARALDFDPKKRFASCAALIDELENSGKPGIAPPPIAFTSAPPTEVKLKQLNPANTVIEAPRSNAEPTMIVDRATLESLLRADKPSAADDKPANKTNDRKAAASRPTKHAQRLAELGLEVVEPEPIAEAPPIPPSAAIEVAAPIESTPPPSTPIQAGLDEAVRSEAEIKPATDDISAKVDETDKCPAAHQEAVPVQPETAVELEAAEPKAIAEPQGLATPTEAIALPELEASESTESPVKAAPATDAETVPEELDATAPVVATNIIALAPGDWSTFNSRSVRLVPLPDGAEPGPFDEPTSEADEVVPNVNSEAAEEAPARDSATEIAEVSTPAPREDWHNFSSRSVKLVPVLDESREEPAEAACVASTEPPPLPSIADLEGPAKSAEAPSQDTTTEPPLPLIAALDVPAINTESSIQDIAIEPAPPVEPTRLLNEGQQEHDSAVATKHETETPSLDVNDDVLSQTARLTPPFRGLFPHEVPATEWPTAGLSAANQEIADHDFAEPQADSNSADDQPAPNSPFAPDFVPSSEPIDDTSNWSFPSAAKGTSDDADQKTTGEAPTTDRTATENEEPVVSGQTVLRTSSLTPMGDTVRDYQPYNVPLRTSALMPSETAPTAKAEAPKPVFRTLRSLRRGNEGASGKHGGNKVSGQTSRRRAEDLKALLDAAIAAVPPNEPERWLTTEEEGEVLECRFPASLPPSGPPINFERIREKWNGQIVSIDEDMALFEVGPPKKFWKRILGRPTPLLVEVRWSRPRPPAVGIPGIIMRVRAAEKDKHASATLHKIGPQLVEGLRSQLQGGSERRGEKRILWVQPVTATFQLSNGDSSGDVEGQSRDLSSTGMGLYLPRILPGTQVTLRLTDPAAQPVTVVGKFMRVQRCGDGWYEVGVRFES